MPSPINGNPISVTPIPDNELSPTSERAVKNKVVYKAIDDLNRQLSDLGLSVVDGKLNITYTEE